ncbi:hypothetical protein ACFQBQ_06625 [Granulicella cerasi]|uniref:DUF4131 domain-containing protein n=1 Tax=Granulicella cerasi TaxID=741063 RepID=A0ABW1Z723_9BACT|nr:hypothetical protein [Granulicella cerasi]
MLLALCCLLTLPLRAQLASQSADTGADTSVGGALRSLANRAQLVFVGQVISITRKSGVVEVAFRVDTTVTGVSSGDGYILREWAGLWPPGMQRYHVGDRAMVFAAAPSEAGLSTPVDGAEGVVPVLLQADSSAPLLDVRRLATRVQRAEGTALATLGEYASLDEVTAVVRGSRDPHWQEPHKLPVPIVRRPVLFDLPEGAPLIPISPRALRGVADAQ